MSEDFAAAVSGVGALADPVRRSLYRFICSQADAVDTDQAAAATGVARHNAKFHLDKLAKEGLLETEFRRPEGRGGPGAGRPTKFFRRADRELSVSLPARHYELAGEILANAVDDSVRDRGSVLDAVLRNAARAGSKAAESTQREEGAHDPWWSICHALTAHGYEPRQQGGSIVLANCPFHALARNHTELVCGMNLALVGAVAERLGKGALTARLQPGEGRCCVVVSPS